MRPEKNYLLREVHNHIDNSSYIFVTDFSRLTVLETAELRAALTPLGAQFHVVKNSLLKVAMNEKSLPSMESALIGPTAVVTGGTNPAAVAKVLVQFAKSKDKVAVKAGVMDNELMSQEDIKFLSTLPSIEGIRAQLLGLFTTPAQQFVRVLQAASEKSA